MIEIDPNISLTESVRAHYKPIIDYIAEHPHAKPREVAKALHVPVHEVDTARRYVGKQ